MKKNLLILALAGFALIGLFGFTQYEGDEQSFCTVKVYGLGAAKDICGIHIFKNYDEVKSIKFTSNDYINIHKQVHQVLCNLKKENWHLVSSHSMGVIREYNLEK